jgi:hypothetical protein
MFHLSFFIIDGDMADGNGMRTEVGIRAEPWPLATDEVMGKNGEKRAEQSNPASSIHSTQSYTNK